jgi:hypothetical protein
VKDTPAPSAEIPLPIDSLAPNPDSRTVLLLVAWLTTAQVADAGAQADQRRSRFGIGLISGALVLGQDSGQGLPAAVATVAGFDLRLGTQYNDHFAVMYDGSLTVIWPQLTSGVLFEWTPVNWFSGAIGPSLNWTLPVFGGGQGGFGFEEVLGIGAPLRIAFNLPLVDQMQVPADPWVGRGFVQRRRTAIAFSFTVTPGVAYVTGGYQSGFQLGLMGGISYEMY